MRPERSRESHKRAYNEHIHDVFTKSRYGSTVVSGPSEGGKPDCP